MRARVIAAILAGVLAFIGVIAMVAWALSARSAAFGNAEMVKVYKVTQTIPANSDAKTVAGSSEQVEIPKIAVATGAITNLSTIGSKLTTVELEPGEQLIASRFSEGGTSSGGAQAIPDGLQQISLQLAAAPASSPVLTTGSSVGLIVSGKGNDGQGTSSSRMFASQVPVVLVTGDSASSSTQSVIVTLAVTEEQALQIADAVNFGTISLTVQNGKTAQTSGASVPVTSVLP
jgi:pilus assembly protein CpaB